MTAIYSKITTGTNTFKTAIGGRFYFNDAPLNTVYPYCVGYVTNGSIDKDTKTDLRTYRVQFNIFQRRLTANESVITIAEKLIDLLPDAPTTLTVTGWSFRRIQEVFTLEVPQENVDYDQYTVTYDILIQKTRS